jgi:hypothetical protein
MIIKAPFSRKGLFSILFCNLGGNFNIFKL